MKTSYKTRICDIEFKLIIFHLIKKKKNPFKNINLQIYF